MTSQVTEWFPLPEVAEDSGAWESAQQQHTEEEPVFQPSKASGSVKASTARTQPTHQFPPGSYGRRSAQPHLHRTLHPGSSHVTPAGFHLSSTPQMSLELPSQSSTLLYTPAEAVTASHGKQGNHGSRKASREATRLTSVTPTSHIKSETPSSENASRLVPTGVGDLTITSILSTSGQSEPGEVVTGRDLHPSPHHYPSHCVGSVASGDTLTGYTSGDCVSTASGYTNSRGYSQPLTSYGGSEPNRTAYGPPPLAPTLTLTELDQLWRRFLASSLSSHQPLPRHDQTVRKDYPTRSSVATTTSSGEHLHCTCYKSTVPRAVPSEGSSRTVMQDRYTELLGVHGEQEGITRAWQTDPRTRSPGLGQLDFTRGHVPSCPPNTTMTTLSHSRMVPVQDTSVQTTPSLQVPPAMPHQPPAMPHPPPTMPHPPPISFSIRRQQQAPSTPAWSQEPRKHTLTQLTLQEALTAFHPDFVQQSCERQRSLRERWRNRVDGRHRPPPAGCREGARPPPLGYREGAPQPEKTPRFFFVDSSNCRPRMSVRQMYQQSKRCWHQLPEVRQKVTQEKRRSEAATNRLRVKLYQKPRPQALSAFFSVYFEPSKQGQESSEVWGQGYCINGEVLARLRRKRT